MPPSYFEDIDRASIELRQFLDVMESSQDEERGEMTPTVKALIPYSFKFPFQRIANQEQLTHTNLSSLSDLYDRLIDTWVASLPKSASGRMRLAKERTARRVAAELYLSGIGVMLKDPERQREADPGERVRSRGQSIEMPVRPRGRPPGVTGKGKGKEQREPSGPVQLSTRDTSLELEAGQVGSSVSSQPQSLFPTPDTTPSHYSYLSSSLGESGTEDASCTRLRAYTSLTPQPSLPPTMSSILAHWKVGSDPSSYSWNATRAALADGDGGTEPTSGGDEASLRRLRREKRLKRQRLGTVESAASSLSVGTDRLWGSQPVAVAQSSQGQADKNIASSSQVVRGIYGGQLARPTAHRRKKRAAGF
jgi:RNA polymerase I-specific transcription initiation factor RRN6